MEYSLFGKKVSPMGQEVDEHNLLDKKESEDYHYVKEVKKNPEPGIGFYYDLLHPRRDGLCAGTRGCS
jgi:hypothetical protein